MNRNLPRRRFLQAAVALPASGLLTSASADAEAGKRQVEQAITDFFGSKRRVQNGRVTVSVPAISENGYSVPLSVAVDSPMTADDYVRRVLVVSQSNPLPIIASFELGPRAGLAKMSTRIRLADSQRIYAIAEMHDGALWSGYGHSIVTLAACVI